jgi:hypothetical protein
MQGIFVDGRRPKSKAEIKRILAEDANRVALEATSMFGNEYEGWIADLPKGTYTFVGPCPYASRKFYGKLTVDARGIARIS